MALTQALCNSFKMELLQGTHDFTATTGDTFMMALFTDLASQVGSFGANTLNYSEMGGDEVTGTGYTAGGIALTNVTPVLDGSVAILDFPDITFTNVTITTRGALIYNQTEGGRAVGVFDFGSDKTATAGNIEILFPAPAAASAIIRLT